MSLIYNQIKIHSNPLIPDEFFFQVFFCLAPREGREKPLGEVLENSVQYKKKFYTASGRPEPDLPKVESRISTPNSGAALTHRNFLVIRTVP